MIRLQCCAVCETEYATDVFEGECCVYCLLKRAFRIMKDTRIIGAGEAAVHAECAREAVYHGKNPAWPRRKVREVTG